MPTLKDRPTDAKPRQDAGTSVEANNPLALTKKRLDAEQSATEHSLQEPEGESD